MARVACKMGKYIHTMVTLAMASGMQYDSCIIILEYSILVFVSGMCGKVTTTHYFNTAMSS